MGLLPCPKSPSPDPLNLTEWGEQERDRVGLTESDRRKEKGKGRGTTELRAKRASLPLLLPPQTLAGSLLFHHLLEAASILSL